MSGFKIGQIGIFITKLHNQFKKINAKLNSG
jgi:hypothetical protein